MEPTDILQTEAVNHYRIYLYLHKGIVWGCCGRSACLLHRLYPNISCAEREIDDTGVRLPVMMIDHMTLKHLIENIPPVEQGNDRMVIELPEKLRLLCDNRQT